MILKNEINATITSKEVKMLLSIFLFIVGLILMIVGADYFVKGASSLAAKFKIPQIIIGLTIVAMGTSAPEASVSISSALKGSTGVAIGNVLGSNIINILFILGLTASVCPLKLEKNSVKYEVPFLILITILLGVFGYYFNILDRFFGILLLTLFIGFFIYLFKVAQNSHQEEATTGNLHPILMLIFIFGGLTGLVYGSNIAVSSAIDIAKLLNISERIIGLTIVALGTSLPELVTSVIAAIKKQADIAIGNIVGSNIFNILFVLGLTCTICPVTFDVAFIFDAIVAILTVVLLFIFTVGDRKLNRWDGWLLVVLYVAYTTYLVIK